MYNFNYHRPSSLDEAKSALSGAEDGKLLGGGMTFIPTMKQRLASPSDVIDLGGIAELKGVCEDGDAIMIGAATTHAEVANNDLVKSKIPALAALAEGIGDPQVRNRGTIGGSIANADPAADYPAAVVGLGATVKTDRREIAGDDFFTDLFETALEEDEIILSVSFPVPAKAAYAKFPNPASRYAIVGVMAADGRLAVTGAAGSVFRWSEGEEAWASGGSLDGASLASDNLNSDIHASAEYRANLVKVMAKRAIDAAG